MSGPNSEYDPVEVTPLKADEVEAMREAALAAIARRPTSTRSRQVRLDHAGDRSPLALANREIGALPPQARKDAGQRVGQARGAVSQALAQPAGRARGRARGADARRGARRRHPALGPAPARRPAPDDHAVRSGSPTSSWRWAGRSPRAPWSRPSGSTSTRSTSAPTTRRAPCRTPSGLDPAEDATGAAHPHLAGAGAHDARRASPPSTSSAPAGSSAPTSTTPRTARSSTRSRASSSTRASRWPT